MWIVLPVSSLTIPNFCLLRSFKFSHIIQPSSHVFCTDLKHIDNSPVLIFQSSQEGIWAESYYYQQQFHGLNPAFFMKLNPSWFVRLTYINWKHTTCQVLLQLLEAHQWAKQNKKGFSSWSLQSKENRLSNSNKPIYWKINICSVTSTELKALYQSGWFMYFLFLFPVILIFK